MSLATIDRDIGGHHLGVGAGDADQVKVGDKDAMYLLVRILDVGELVSKRAADLCGHGHIWQISESQPVTHVVLACDRFADTDPVIFTIDVNGRQGSTILTNKRLTPNV